MSRAFVSEEAADAAAAQLPERPVSTAPNLVTPRGLGLIEAEIERLSEARAASEPGDPARAIAERDLRYWTLRRASATIVPPVSGRPEEVSFGCRVTLLREDGRQVSYRIVGEDEADPAAGLLSWTSPLARALMDARVGDTVDAGGGRAAATLQAIEAG